MAPLLAFALTANAAFAQSVLRVDASALPGGDGSSWQSAFRDLQDALDTARQDSAIREIWIAGGTYYPDRGTGDIEQYFELVSNVSLYGGFRGDEQERPPREQRLNVTVLSGDIGVAHFADDNSRTIVEVPLESEMITIDGLTLADANGSWGAIHMAPRTHAINVSGCRFTNNRAAYGAGILADSTGLDSIVDCDFDSNTANHGGGLYLNNIDTTTEIINCRFSNNHALGFGGAMDNVSSHAMIRNCTFINNVADREGGALSNSGGDAQFVNCIMWENAPLPIRDQESITTITYTCITGGWPGEGNFSADPGLVDPANGDLRLAPNSPCIDAGDNDGVPPEQTLDLDFNPRFADDPGTPDTGRGTPPIVDLGCYEFQGTSFALLDPTPNEAGRINRLSAIGAAPGATIWFTSGRADGAANVPGCPGLVVNIASPRVLGNATANANGIAAINRFVPLNVQGVEIILQCVDQQRCLTTRAIRATFN